MTASPAAATRIHPVVAHLATHPVSSLEEYGIYARWSIVNPRKVTLNYDQIEATDGHLLVNACRGLVLRQAGTGPQGDSGRYDVLAHPFPRFYNLGSGHAPEIDWTTAAFEEKLDGTLCIVYFDHDLDRWCVATRSVPDADIPNATGDTFADLFWRHSGAADVGAYSTGRTYCYELTGPGNQIVVPYDDWRCTLLASFDNLTGEELTGEAPRHRFGSLDEARAWLAQQPGHAFEGFVVRDAQGRRVKVKSSQYLAVARVMTVSGSDSGLVEIVLSGTADDVRAFLPAVRQQRLDAFATAVREWAQDVEAFVATLPKGDRKAAALATQASPFAGWMGPVMTMWCGQVPSVAGWLDRQKQAGVVQRSTVDKIAAEVAARVSP